MCLNKEFNENDKIKFINIFENLYNSIYVITPKLTLQLIQFTLNIKKTYLQYKIAGIISSKLNMIDDSEKYFEKCVLSGYDEICISKLLNLYYINNDYEKLQNKSQIIIDLYPQYYDVVEFYLILSGLYIYNEEDGRNKIIQYINKVDNNINISYLLDQYIHLFGIKNWDILINEMYFFLFRINNKKDKCTMFKYKTYFPNEYLPDIRDYFINKIEEELLFYVDNVIDLYI